MKRLFFFTRILYISCATLLIGFGLFIIIRFWGSEFSQITTFEECIRNYPVMESYPRQCKTPDGKFFKEEIGNELEKHDLIRLSSPKPNDSIKSPTIIEGEARGFWFFEANFPVRLLDGNGKEIAIAVAQAQGEWMTENFVPFKATLSFNIPVTSKGVLVLEKDNPSGLQENADALYIPVSF